MLQSKQGRISSQTNNSTSPHNSVKKSLRNIREKSHQEFYNNRLNKLSNILTQQGLDLHAAYSEDEILNVLDSIGKEPFSRDIGAQLFEKMPFQEYNDDKRYILSDFVDTHIKAEYFLLLRAEEIEGELDTIYSQIEGLKDQFQEAARKTEARIENNTLQVDIIEVVCDDENYEAEIGSTFSVVVIVGNYKYETDEIVIDEPKFNPKFNWTFHFKFDTPHETLKIQLRDQNRFAADENYSDLKCTINLKNYKDQIRHVSWLTLYNFHNQPTKFKVHLAIQWQFSRLAFQEEKFNELQAIEEKLSDEKEYIEMSIKYLVHPFAFASSSLKRNVSQGMKSELGIRMTQSEMADPHNTPSKGPYGESNMRITQSYHSEQNIHAVRQTQESNKSASFMPDMYNHRNSKPSSEKNGSPNPNMYQSEQVVNLPVFTEGSERQSIQSKASEKYSGRFPQPVQNTNFVGYPKSGPISNQGDEPQRVSSQQSQSRAYSQAGGYPENPKRQSNASDMYGNNGPQAGNAQYMSQPKPYNQAGGYPENPKRQSNASDKFGNSGPQPVNAQYMSQPKPYSQAGGYPENPKRQSNASDMYGGPQTVNTQQMNQSKPYSQPGGFPDTIKRPSNASDRNYPQQNYPQEQRSNPTGFHKAETFAMGGLPSNSQSPSNASETNIKRIAPKNPFEASQPTGNKLVPQTTGFFGVESPARMNNSMSRRTPSDSEKGGRSPFDSQYEASVGINAKKFENQSYQSNQGRGQNPGYSQGYPQGYRQAPAGYDSRNNRNY